MMNKAKILVQNKNEILRLAKAAGIDSILVYRPLYIEMQEDDDFVHCYVSCCELNKVENRSDQVALLRSFHVAIENIVGFKLFITLLSNAEATLKEYGGDEWKKQYQTYKNMIDAAIPLEKLTETPSLFQQLNESMARLEASQVTIQENHIDISECPKKASKISLNSSTLFSKQPINYTEDDHLDKKQRIMVSSSRSPE